MAFDNVRAVAVFHQMNQSHIPIFDGLNLTNTTTADWRPMFPNIKWPNKHNRRMAVVDRASFFLFCRPGSSSTSACAATSPSMG